MQVIVDDNPVFAKAHEKFENFTKNDELVEFYEAHQKWIMDRDTAIGYAEKKGIEQGLKDAVSRLKDKGLSAAKISELLDIPLEDIER